MKINMFWGVLILVVIVAIFVPDVEISSPQFSPGETQENTNLGSGIGILHSECANACSKRECITSESYKEGDLYVCECKECKISEKGYKLTSENRLFE